MKAPCYVGTLWFTDEEAGFPRAAGAGPDPELRLALARTLLNGQERVA